MTPYVGLFTVWGAITLLFAVLVIYRRRLTSHDTDWIPLTDDEKEERAIVEQTTLEQKADKLTWPIRALGSLSVLLLLVILGYWVYIGIMTPPPTP